MKRLLLTLALAALLIVGVAGTALAAEPPAAAGTLTQAETDALLRALDDEYHAWAIYDQVIKDFGQVRPFTNIRQAETSHIAALTNLLNVYGAPVPANTWTGNVPHFESVTAAAAAGAQAEIANAALYDTLKATTTRADILRVYNSLQSASIQKHLPAFERAAGTTTTQTGNTGRGWRSR
jgi:hypothetical protein